MLIELQRLFRKFWLETES